MNIKPRCELFPSLTQNSAILDRIVVFEWQHLQSDLLQTRLTRFRSKVKLKFVEKLQSKIASGASNLIGVTHGGWLMI